MFVEAAIILYAFGYGVTMKVADLLNEHGLKWFAGSPILMGILWGIFGALLVYADNTVANIILAMNLAYLLRNRLDYPNHQFASTLIILAFILFAQFELYLFLTFYLISMIFGSLKDYFGDVLKKEDTLGLLVELGLHYPIPTLVYCLLYGNWIVFWVFFTFSVAYNFTKLMGRGYKYV